MAETRQRLHPEMKDGEAFMGNVYVGDPDDDLRRPQSGDGGWEAIRWNSKRMGEVAYSSSGDILPHYRPVFVQRSEMLAAGVTPD